jgi:hypothetical protein
MMVRVPFAAAGVPADALEGGGGVGAHIDIDITGPPPGDKAVFTVDHLLHIRRGWQGGDNDAAGPGDVSGGGPPCPPFFQQGGRRLFYQIVDGEAMPGGEYPGGHVFSHLPDADKANVHHYLRYKRQTGYSRP